MGGSAKCDGLTPHQRFLRTLSSTAGSRSRSGVV